MEQRGPVLFVDSQAVGFDLEDGESRPIGSGFYSAEHVRVGLGGRIEVLCPAIQQEDGPVLPDLKAHPRWCVVPTDAARWCNPEWRDRQAHVLGAARMHGDHQTIPLEAGHVLGAEVAGDSLHLLVAVPLHRPIAVAMVLLVGRQVFLSAVSASMARAFDALDRIGLRPPGGDR